MGLRKTLYVLNVEGYAPQITALTYPLLRYYADRIGAEFFVIDKRQYPDWPVVYEKIQIFEWARQRDDDWSIYLDSDALVHPECPDWTDLLPMDTVAHNGYDMAAVRWDYDAYFRRDGRHIGSCNWLAIASRWCRDLWQPLDMPLAEALSRIHPTVDEENAGITPDHLIDDFTLSRNIARYGLKFTSIIDLLPRVGLKAGSFWHKYAIPAEQKVAEMRETLETWKVPARIRTYGI